ncbi:MAG: hypothetical protein E7102_06220 [Prevotella ruminicola]|jgi:hypothetical protein|uniref:Uncharacterized protein n=1 Tax=Xylanibacter ruminicola TaxID=839 RepID=A0A928GHE0_XYLRU|nr:hypothetical protein [Xylanibacter ruminicola]
MNKLINKTTTIDGMMAVSENDLGLKYVQFLPDNPCVGLMEAFHGFGYFQMLSNGSCDFIQKKRHRNKPEFKGYYASLSFCADGYDRVTFVVPNDMRAELPKILRKGIFQIIAHLIKKGFAR